MEFLDTLKEKISQTTRVVTKKSNELVEITKLKASAAEVERDISRMFREIGQGLYEAYKTDESYAGAEDAFASLDEAHARLAELQGKIGELRNVKKCPVCQKDMERNAEFCSACGAKFE